MDSLNTHTTMSSIPTISLRDPASKFEKNFAELQLVLFNRTADALAMVSRSFPVVHEDHEHFGYAIGDILHDQIMGELGEGGFGKVFKVKNITNDQFIALKISRNGDTFREATLLEVRVLETLNSANPSGEFLCVKMLEWFELEGRVVIGFQLLGMNLIDFMEENNYHTYSMEHIRHISYQMCHAVSFLHKKGITHTDLKPENILFLDSDFEVSSTNIRRVKSSEIRVIDFGMSAFDCDPHPEIITTRHYRAPEVILKLGWGHSCDVWSIGCILFEIYLGITLFPTDDDLEHLAMIERTIGPIPTSLSSMSPTGYMDKEGSLAWNEDSLDGRYIIDNFLPLFRYMKSDNEDTRKLFDLIFQMLNCDPSKRISPQDAMHHPFFDKLPIHQRRERNCDSNPDLNHSLGRNRSG